MAFDAECSTYWCDECGKMMDVDYKHSIEFGVVFKCTDESCNFRLYFVSVDKAGYEEVPPVIGRGRGVGPTGSRGLEYGGVERRRQLRSGLPRWEVQDG